MVLAPGLAWAGDSARDYLNAPINTWLTFSNSGYSMSVTPEDGLDVTSPIRTNVFSQAVIVTRTIDLRGRTGGISAIVPYAALDLNTDVFDASNAGFSDLGLMFQTNIFGGSALTREQFGSFVPQTFSSFHLVVNAPTGKYDAGSLLNPSSNRWTFFPTINYSYTRPTRAGPGWRSTLHRDFSRQIRTSAPAPSELDQDPLYLAEFHASRNINSRLWLSADAAFRLASIFRPRPSTRCSGKTRRYGPCAAVVRAYVPCMGDLKSISSRHRDLQRLCLSVIEFPEPVPSKNGNETIPFLVR